MAGWVSQPISLEPREADVRPGKHAFLARLCTRSGLESMRFWVGDECLKSYAAYI
jgi:hypothetical protein